MVLAAFFSGSETALFSLSTVRVHRLQEEKKKGASLVSQILKEPRKILATILLANLFVTVLSTSLAEGMSVKWFGPQGLEICIGVMSLLILVFCEIVPKVVAVSHAERVALRIAPLLKWVMWGVAPIRILFLKVANGFIHVLLKNRSIPHKDPVHREQLKTALQMGHQEGILQLEEFKMLEGILDLNGRTVQEVMTPREKVMAFELQTPISSVYEVLKRKRLSRIPVYRKTLDEVLGILYAKDLVMQEILEWRAIQVYDLLREPYFISPLLALDQLLKEFKIRRLHMALVKDDAGKFLGLITLDDLMGSVIGMKTVLRT